MTEQREYAQRRLRVYVAGPISSGDVFENVVAAVRVGKQMVKDGLAPYVPHFDAYMFPGEDVSWNAFLEWDLEWVAQADCVFRLPGSSTGADLEVEVACGLDIPVFTEYMDLMEFAGLVGLTGVRR